MSKIHRTAVISAGASIGDGVEIGPFSVIGPDVALGEGTRIHSHVVISGHTTLGRGCEVYPFTTLGEPPQDTKYRGEPTRLEIGDGTLFREHVTVHRGTPQGAQVTRVGSNCFFMINAHVAHDCQIGDSVILINQATLAGHCEVGDHAVLGATCVVQQHTRLGKHSYLAAAAGISTDLVPFGVAKGIRQTSRHAALVGLNVVGIKQRGFTREEIKALRESYRIIFDGSPSGIQERAASAGERFSDCRPVGDLVAFIQARPERSLCSPEQSSDFDLGTA